MRGSGLFGLLVFAGLALAPGIAPAQTAADLVRWVYTNLADDTGLGLWDLTSPSRRHEFLTPRLAAVFDANDAATEEPCIDFAPEIDAQDYDGPELMRTLALATATTATGGQTVTATFTIFGEPRHIVWSFQPSGGQLLLDDITGASGNLADVVCAG